MRILLDEVSTTLEEMHFVNLEAEPTFRLLFSHLFEVYKKEGRVISDVLINSKRVQFNELKKFFEIRLDEFDSLEFFTVNKEELFEKIRDMAGGFFSIANRLEELSILLNEGKDEKVLDILREVLSMMQTLFLSHSLFLPLGIPLEYPVGGKTLVEYKNEVTSLLKGIVDAFEKKDMVEVSDLAEYELSPLLLSLGNGIKDIV